MTSVEVAQTLTAVHALDPITLDELVELASLQTRVDRKYVLPLTAAGDLVGQLGGEAQALQIDDRRWFGYESLYYDTPDLTSYLLAARGRRRRFKVRRRTYVETGQSYLEVKTRGMRGTTVKTRMAYDGDPSGALRRDAVEFVDDVLHAAGIDNVNSSSLLPTLQSSYRRATLYLPATGTRVTLDTGLCWSLPPTSRRGVDDVVIVETKSGAAASAVDRRLWSHGYRPCRISKYGTGLAALREELPSNKWRQVMRRHVMSAPTFSTALDVAAPDFQRSTS